MGEGCIQYGKMFWLFYDNEVTNYITSLSVMPLYDITRKYVRILGF